MGFIIAGLILLSAILLLFGWLFYCVIDYFSEGELDRIIKRRVKEFVRQWDGDN